MTDSSDPVFALVAQWRQEAQELDEATRGQYVEPRVLLNCADELSAALAARQGSDTAPVANTLHCRKCGYSGWHATPMPIHPCPMCGTTLELLRNAVRLYGQIPEGSRLQENNMPIMVDRDADLRIELRRYLDTLTITGDTIGDLRRLLFMPWDSAWNGWVRDETASREQRAVVAVPAIGPQHEMEHPIWLLCNRVDAAESQEAILWLTAEIRGEVRKLITDQQVAAPAIGPPGDPVVCLCSELRDQVMGINEDCPIHGEAPAIGLPVSECSECAHVFSAKELAAEDPKAWGHPCWGMKRKGVCEAFRRPCHLAAPAIGPQETTELTDAESVIDDWSSKTISSRGGIYTLTRSAWLVLQELRRLRAAASSGGGRTQTTNDDDPSRLQAPATPRESHPRDRTADGDK